VGDLLNKGAERIAQGENASIVAKQIQREIGDSIERELANSGMKATPQELAPPPPPPPIPEPDRATLEAHAIQRAIANGEVRPTEMQPLDLPPAPSADIRAVQRELAAMDPTLPLEDQLPNMPATRQAAADELRLAAEYARQDAEIAWAAETAAREAEGYDMLSLQEKKAQGLGAEWLEPVTPEVMDTTVMEAVGRARPTDELIRREKRNEALTQKADALARAKRSVLDIQHGLDNLEQTRPGPDARKWNVTAWNRNVKKYTGDLKLAKEAVVDAQKAMDAQQALADAEWELALNDATPEVMDTTVMPKESKTPIADAFGKLMRDMVESDARMFRELGEFTGEMRRQINNLADVDAPPTGKAAKKPKQLPSRSAQIASEVSGAPEFTLPPELAKASPRYGRNKLQFESDLDRAAYVLANDKAKGGSKSADKFRNELIAAGFDPDQVAAHGKTVKEAVKAAARDTSAETVVVPVQDFAAGRPRLPLPEQQRQIDGTRAQIDDLQQKLNEGGCGT
jgi:hypothetical protein